MAEKTYPGTPPGWKPDMNLADRGFDAQSIEDQAKAAAASWRLDPLNPDNKLSKERQIGYVEAPAVDTPAEKLSDH